MRGFSEILAKKQALDEARPLPAELVERVSDWFERELLCQQDAMAGRTLGRERIENLLAAPPDPQAPDLDPEVVALLRHRLALAWVGRVSYPGAPAPTLQSVAGLHRIIGTGPADGAGRWRTGPPRLDSSEESEYGRSGVILPHHSKIELLMRGFGAWLAAVEASPESAVEAHFRLARIQPFPSDNLVVGRLIMNAILGRAGYPPIVVPAAALDTYLSELAVALVEGDKSGWRGFLMPRLGESLDLCLVAAAQAVAARQAEAAQTGAAPA